MWGINIRPRSTRFDREVAASLEEIDLTAADAVDVSALDLHTKGLTGLSVIIATQIGAPHRRAHEP